MTSDDRDFIERCFKDGMREGEYADQAAADLALPRASACPYDEHSMAARWWTRGFSYQARNLRAIRAERLNAELLAALKHVDVAVQTARNGEPDIDMYTVRAVIAKAEGR